MYSSALFLILLEGCQHINWKVCWKGVSTVIEGCAGGCQLSNSVIDTCCWRSQDVRKHDHPWESARHLMIPAVDLACLLSTVSRNIFKLVLYNTGRFFCDFQCYVTFDVSSFIKCSFCMAHVTEPICTFQAQALVKERERELHHKILLLKSLHRERDQMRILLKKHDIPLDNFVKVGALLWSWQAQSVKSYLFQPLSSSLGSKSFAEHCSCHMSCMRLFWREPDITVNQRIRFI